MTLHALAVPYVDSVPSDLAWAVNLDAQPAMCTEELVVGDITLQLRLLGMSHQVLLSGPDLHFSETVACVPGGEALPANHHDNGYRFASLVETFAQPTFDARADAIVSALERRDTTSVAAVFPGSTRAITAMEVVHFDDTSARWQTWHAYPQANAIVWTQSRVTWSAS